MARKKGFLSEYQRGGLDGFTKVLDATAKVMNKPELDVANLFYASIFQAGLNEMVMFERNWGTGGLPASKFVKSRVSELPVTHYLKYHMPLDSVFKSMLSDDYADKNEYKGVPGLMELWSKVVYESLRGGVS